jgi:hypothetical protein
MKSGFANLIKVSLMSVTYGGTMRLLVFLALLPPLAFGGEIFTRDGVTDGDTFYLAPQAYSDDDPVLQSWVTYSLIKAACQLEIGGDNPARNSNYGCEFTARQHLVEAWEAQRAEHEGAADAYLDDLLRVRDAGFLDEYTVLYFGRKHWQVPAEVRVDDFRAWQSDNLRKHKPQMRITGSWNYRPL